MSQTEARTDGRVLKGEQTRRLILRRAVDIASAEGLEGLSIGRLATELELSKSGVFTHFGSKEELQLATIRAAREIFIEQVVEPIRAVPPGLGRIWATFEIWLKYETAPVFAGGCFFYSAAAEFDARPGRVRDAISHAVRDWTSFYERVLREAQELGELDPSADPAQLAFEFDAFGRAGGGDGLLHDDPMAYERARRAVLTRLHTLATDPSTLPDL